jgi:hypothetical protein
MKPEDFPLVTKLGRRLLVVPELPHDGSDCTMCLAYDDRQKLNINRGKCAKLRKELGDCGYHESRGHPRYHAQWNPAGYIYLPEEQFEEYVAEIVRRRVS